MWNATFPHQIANEIEVIFANKNGGDERQRFQVEDRGQPLRRLTHRHQQLNAPEPQQQQHQQRRRIPLDQRDRQRRREEREMRRAHEQRRRMALNGVGNGAEHRFIE